MMENSTSYAVDQKMEGRFAMRRAGLITLYIAVVLAFFVLICVTRIVPLFAICPFLLAILIMFTWRYTQVTYEYNIEVGDISFAKIYGNRSRRNVLTLHVRELVSVYPAEAEAPKEYKKVYDFRSSVKTPDGYCIEFGEGSELSLIRFEATRKALKLISMYNPLAVHGHKELRH